MDSNTEEMFISFVSEATFLASSMDSEALSLYPQLFSTCISEDMKIGKFLYLLRKIQSLSSKMEFLSLTEKISGLQYNKISDSEWRVLLSLIAQIIFLVGSMDLDLDSDSELISFVKQIISLFNSKPDSDSELVSLITQTMRLGISVEPTQESELLSLVSQLVSLKPEPELTSLIRRIISRFKSMNWEPLHFILFCPQAKVALDQGKFRVMTESADSRERERSKKGECSFVLVTFSKSTTENHFHCGACDGKNHDEYDKAPIEVKHPLHPKHSLYSYQLIYEFNTRECYCCDEDIKEFFYYCLACDFAINIACVKKPPRLLSIDHPKWHKHPLTLFPSHAPLTCHLCATTHPKNLFYVCSPCDFVVHSKCLSLPRVIKISRHPQHRISFTPTFDQEDRPFCGICRKKIDNDYGGYSCIKSNCSYAAHSTCATLRDVWDGEELDGVPEEIEEVLEPFLTVGDGIIQHFSHQQHPLRRDDNA